MAETIYMVNGARTPMGGLLGDLADVTAVDLGASAVKATLDKTGVEAAQSMRYLWVVYSQLASSSAPPDKP